VKSALLDEINRTDHDADAKDKVNNKYRNVQLLHSCQKATQKLNFEMTKKILRIFVVKSKPSNLGI
jgi:hypothetical protein